MKKKRIEKSISKNVEGIDDLLPMEDLMSYPHKKQKFDADQTPPYIDDNQMEDESPS